MVRAYCGDTEAYQPELNLARTPRSDTTHGPRRLDRGDAAADGAAISYNWSVSREEHTWNHDTKGVCHYCTHCMRLMEEWPIDRFGYPVRVIDPPVYPDTSRDPDARQKRQWQMFKDPTKVPEEYCARVDRTRPEKFGSKAIGAPDLPPPQSGMLGAG